ncbi:hypothetical protein [Elioraea sp.]|uniref:hypothetical protein n=1 Tax=Elioraea sp. TaxID=2185103 RepID=UPI003F708E24
MVMAVPWVCIGPNVPLWILRAQIVGVLDPEEAYPRRRIDAIDFVVDGFVVSGARLRGVGAAVREGRIGVRVGSTGPHFGAAYSRGPNRHFTFGAYDFQPNDGWRSVVVHEAVHASFDLANERPPNEIDEAAAYLGETVWFRAGGLARSVTAPAAAAAIYGAANEIVARLNLHASRGQRLLRSQVQELIAAINAHPGYSPSQPP